MPVNIYPSEKLAMTDFRTSVPRVRMAREHGPVASLKERIASIYRNRSTSLANLFFFRGVEGDRAEVVTPFLDPTNTRISVFIEASDGKFVISDGGLALQIVAKSGRSDGMAVLHDLTHDYGLTLSEHALCIDSSEADLLARQFRLCNALVALRDRLVSQSPT